MADTFVANLDPNQFLRGIRAMREGVQDLTGDSRQFNNTVVGANRSVNTLRSSVDRLARSAGNRAFSLFRNNWRALSLSVVGSAAGFVFAANRLADFATQLDEAAQIAGVGTERYFQLSRAFGEFGVRVDQVFKGINDATRRALAGDSVFAELNIDIERFIELDAEGKAIRLGQALREVDDANLRAAQAQRLGGEEFVKSSNALVALTENYDANINRQRTFRQSTVTNLRTIGDNIGTVGNDIRVIFADIFAAFAPTFQAFRSIWDNQIFPYFEDTVVPRLRGYILNDLTPFVEGIFGFESLQDLQDRRVRLDNELANGLISIDNFVRQTDKLDSEITGAETLEDLNAILATTRTLLDGAEMLFSPFIAGLGKIGDALGDIDLSTFSFDLAALLSPLGTGNFSLIASIFSSISNLGEGDIDDFAATLGITIGKILSKVGGSRLIPDGDFKNLVRFLASEFLSTGFLATIGSIGDDWGFAIIQGIGRAIGGIDNLAAAAGFDLGLERLGSFFVSRFGNIVGAGVIDGLIAGITTGDPAEGIWHAILGITTAGAFIINPFLGIGVLIATLIADELIGDAAVEIIRSALYTIGEFVALDIGNFLIGGVNEAIRQINVINPFTDIASIPLIQHPNLTQFPLEPIPVSSLTGTNGGNSIIGPQPPSNGLSPRAPAGQVGTGTIVVNTTVNIRGKELSQAVYDEIVRLYNDGSLPYGVQ